MNVSISNAELELMRVLWQQSPLNARQIAEQLLERKWHRKTVNTLLSRLENKAAVSKSKHADGISYYTPLVDQQTYQQSATSEFVDQIFEGQLAPLIACFADVRKLSEKQINELQEILKELSDDND